MSSAARGCGFPGASPALPGAFVLSSQPVAPHVF